MQKPGNKNWKKRWHLKTTNRPIKVGDLGIDKKKTDNTFARYLAVLAYMKYKKLHFAELLIPLGVYHMSLKIAPKKKHQKHKYIEFMQWWLFFEWRPMKDNEKSIVKQKIK